MSKLYAKVRERKRSLTLMVMGLFLTATGSYAQEKTASPSGFIENKGQIVDQNNLPNAAVKYNLTLPSLNVQLRANSFSYDAYTVETRNVEAPGDILDEVDELNHQQILFHFHRVDIEFIGANPHPEVIQYDESKSVLNYFTTGTGESGVTGVRTFQKIVYKDLYPGIDLEFVSSPGTEKPFEYNFIVHPGANPALIRWKYKGAPSSIKDNQIFLETRHGKLKERIPHSYLKGDNESLEVSYKSLNKGVYGFNIPAYNHAKTLVIDPLPSLEWATYYGDSGDDIMWGVSLDDAGNVLATGRTTSTSNIATSGVFQSTYGGGSGYGGGGDAFIVKFDASGSRTWTTYYGYSAHEQGQSIDVDASGNCYIQGTTSSASGMGTTGAFQQNKWAGTYNDAFLAKFNANGIRVWGTYFGANGNDRGSRNALSVDASANVYFGGTNNSANNTHISSTGVIQTSNGSNAAHDEPFVAKFDSTGSRVWGTYYGGGGSAHNGLYGMSIDASGKIYLTGRTTSSNLDITTNAHQSSYGGGYDAYLAVIDNNGANVLYGTYYGGSGYDLGYHCATDDNGNMFLVGFSESGGMATTGAHQTTKGGTRDGLMVKFNSGGTVQWATYFGGAGSDAIQALVTNAAGDLFLTGNAGSGSTSGIATSGSYQDTYSGGTNDGFVAKFENGGTQKWGTYFGGSDNDLAAAIVFSSSGPIVAGYAESSLGIASTGAHQTSYGGNRDGFVARFQDLQGQNNAGINKVVHPSGYVCAGSVDIEVEVTNAGLNTIDSVTIEWEINGIAQTAFKLTDSLAPGSNMDVNLGSVTFTANTLTSIKAWTSMPNNSADTANDNDTVFVEIMPGLSGTYTVGGTSPDYATLSEATADLNAFGVCGPVEFTIAAGTYNEQLALGEIEGASVTNTISFIGAGQSSTTISHNGTSTNMATVLIDGADHIMIRDLSIENGGSSIAAGLWLSNGVDSSSFVNLSIWVDSTVTSTNVNGVVMSGSASGISDGTTGNYNRFDSLNIYGGYHGIRLNGGGTSSSYVMMNKVSNSLIRGQYRYGIYLRGQNQPHAMSNVIHAPRNATSTGLTVDYCANVEIGNNQIWSDDYGMHFNYVNRYLYNTMVPSRVYNNMVYSGSDYALYSNEARHLKIWHNSFDADPALAVVRFANFQNIDFSNNHVQNSGSIASRYVFYADNVSNFSDLDYNNYYTANGGFVYLNSSNYANLPVLQAALSQFNQNSYSRDPLFNAVADLHTSINLSGTYVGIDEDIDGDFRNNVAPVVGADEVNVPNNAGVSKILSPTPVFCAGSQDVRVRIGNYGVNTIDSVRVTWAIDGTNQGTIYLSTPIGIRGFLDTTIGTISFVAGDDKELRVWTSMPNGAMDSLRNNDTISTRAKTGLSGTYTLGSSGADYANFSEAIGDLSSLGVCSPVVFEVAAGTYNERLVLREIEGASATNTITFKGGGVANTSLSYSGSNTQDWGTLNLEGGDHYVFRDMTVAAMGTNYGIGILMSAQADSNEFNNVSVQTNPSSTSLNLVNIAALPDPTDLYSGAGNTGDGNVFDSLTVNGGYYGIYFTGTAKYTTITNSTFTDQYVAAISGTSQDYIEVAHNSISPLRNSGFSYSINLTLTNNFKVYGNTINSSGEYALYIAFANVFGSDPNYASSVYNNMVSNTNGYAYYSDGSQDYTVYHNSFRSVGNSNTIDASVFFSGCFGIDLRNNHIRNDNPNSYALQAGSSTFDSLDFNNYYSFGDFVRIGTVYTNLGDLKNGLPQFNASSFSQDPQFISLTNLHTTSYIPGSYVGVDLDIDGEPRCPQTVSIGADDEDWGFPSPIISTNHMDYFANYPVRFQQNIGTLPQMNFEWFIDGVYVTDSVSFGQVFTTAGDYSIELKANRCIHNDSVTLDITIASGDPLIQVIGNNPDSVRVYTSYLDSGANAFDFFNQNINTSLQSGSNLDTSVLGSYFIWYKATDAWGNSDSVIRTVVVIDDVDPMLSLVGPDTLHIDVFSAINEPGSNGTDNYYSSVTIVVDSSNVNTSEVGVYPMYYTGTDGSGNETTITRYVAVSDNELPVIQLFGLDTVIVKVNFPYVEPGAKVTDNYCSNSTLTWEVDAYPNTSLLGDYILTYTAEDCQNNQAVPVKRLVRVVDNESPILYLNGLPVIKIQRWQAYNDAGVSISDNYYSAATLMAELDTVSDLDVNWIGTYSICYQVTDLSGNISNQVCRVVEVVENTTGLADDILAQSHVYPNPNTGTFTLELGAPAAEAVELEVVDITGKRVHAESIAAGISKTTIALGNLSPGVYVVRLSIDGKHTHIKMNITK